MDTREMISDSDVDNSEETGYDSDGLGERMSAVLDRLLTVREICNLFKIDPYKSISE